MEKQKEDEQIPIEGIVIAHELLESGTRLIVVVEQVMESVPRKVKLVW